MNRNFDVARILFLLATAVFVFGACGTAADDTAMVSFSLTDAPDTSGLTNVLITASAIKVNESSSAGENGSGWKTVSLDPPTEFDLLTLTGGVTASVAELEIAGGTQINQIRFIVKSARVSSDNGNTFTDLSVPGDSVKIVNSFQIPLSGSVGITLDFDVRKSLVKTGAGAYKLKPAIRAIVENEAGWITGTAPEPGAIVYLYADGTYVEGVEPTESNAATEIPAFPNAYTSTVADSVTGGFKLAFLDPGSYDILVQKTDGTYNFFDKNLAVTADTHTAAGDLTF